MSFAAGRRAVMAAIAFIVALSLCAAISSAATRARVSVSPGGGRVNVPANIIAGSLVTKGRTFYSPGIYESSLAGIRLGRPAKEILARWGNPTRITLGAVQGEAPESQPPSSIPYTAPGGLNMPELELGGRLPSLPGLPAPGSLAPGLSTGLPSATPPSTGGGESASLRQEEVTWTYDLPNGITLEFIITEGTITQITVGGVGPWSGSKTRMGLQLGDTYKLVLWVAGYPESQKYVGRFLRVSYVEKSRVLFTFLDRKVVGVTIALVPQELTGK